MRWMVNVKRQEANRLGQCQEVCRESWIGHDSNERAFCKRTRRPSVSGISRKPALHSFMGAMGWPCQSDQDVCVQQKSSHYNSFSSSLTRSVVTFGESGGRTTT